MTAGGKLEFGDGVMTRTEKAKQDSRRKGSIWVIPRQRLPLAPFVEHRFDRLDVAGSEGGFKKTFYTHFAGPLRNDSDLERQMKGFKGQIRALKIATGRSQTSCNSPQPFRFH